MSEIDIRMTRARSQLISDHPFYGCLVMRLQTVEEGHNTCPTMETDGSSIFYSRKFLDELSESEILGVVVHEVQHCILSHHTRRNGRDPDRWNKACDYVINPMVLDADFKLPEGALIDRAKFAGLNAEEAYTLLQQEDEQAQKQKEAAQSEDGDGDSQSSPGQESGDEDDEGDDQQGDSGSEPESGDNVDDGDGSGQGQPDAESDSDDQSDDAGEGGQDDADQDQDGDGKPGGDGKGSPVDGEGEDPDGKGQGHDPGRCGGVRDAAPEHDKAALAEQEGEWEIAVRQAVNIAQKAGEQPGSVAEIIKHLGEPRIDWRDVLDRFVDVAQTKDYSTANPMRRMLPFRLYVPGVVSDGVSHLGIAIDSSISVDTAKLEIFGAEVQGLLDGRRVDKVTVIFCDTRVTKVDAYEAGDQIDWTVPGRGGTAFSPAFAWFEDQAPDVQGVIYFTDMECSDFGPEPSYPVLWAGYGDPRSLKAYMAAVPFGEAMDVNAALIR